MNGECEKLEQLIANENDESKRYSLIFVLNGLRYLKALSDKVETINIEHNRRLSDSENVLKNHQSLVLQGQAIMKVFVVSFSFLSACFVGALSYGYTTIFDMRDKILLHDIVLPKLDSQITIIADEFKQHQNRDGEVYTQLEQIKHNQSKLNDIEQAIDGIKQLKVIKGSK